MEIDRDLIDRLATLARLGLTEDEAEEMKLHIQRMLEHVATLDEVDTTDVPPLTSRAWTRDAFRDDEVRPGLEPDDALGPAPSAGPGGFRVPRVLGDAE